MASFVRDCILLIVMAIVIAASESHPAKKQENANDFWSRLPGTRDLEFFDISAKNGNLWGVATNSTVWRYDSQTEIWTNIPFTNSTGQNLTGFPAFISATNDGSAWLTASDGYLYSYAYRWNPSSNEWDSVGEYLRQVSGTTQDQAIGVQVHAEVITAVVEWDDGQWNNVEAPSGLLWAASGDNNDRWLVQDSTSPVYRWYENSTNGWVTMPNPNHDDQNLPAIIDVQNASRVALTTEMGDTFTWTGSGWNQLPQTPARGIGRAAKVTIDYNNLYAIDWDGELYVADF